MLVCPRCEKMYPSNDLERCPDDESVLYVLGSEGPTQRPWGENDIIANKYKLLQVLPKRVGTGQSFKAEQLKLKRGVELRLLSNEGMMKPGEQARFQREVSVWSKVRSPYIVRLYDFGFTERDEPYITLELTEQGTLRDLINRQGYLSYDEGLRLSSHILQALNTAHQAQVLHRNVSPNSIVLHTLSDGQSHYRLTGFAVAKLMGDIEDDPTAITMTGQVICDPAYMAPESIMMGILEPKTDLYALGVTLYEAFSGKRPFPGENLSELLGAHVHGIYTPIESHRPDVPYVLKAFLNRLLHHDPYQRFESAAEALDALNIISEDFEEIIKGQASATGEFKPLILKHNRLSKLKNWFRTLFKRVIGTRRH
jgi:eukaryotic-like serine/threonine-protein kinase